MAHSATIDQRSCDIIIRTPLKMVRDNKAVRTLDAPLFLCSLMRRISSIASAYAGYEMDADFAGLSRSASFIRMIPLDLAYAAKNKSAGFTGHFRLDGDLADFNYFLILGEYLHLGKGASFGMGRYSLINNSTPV